jgi:NADP-dependent 3-hydroxy acid dehydrogenase YdfG
MNKSLPSVGYAFVTGAASGLGREFAFALSKVGWHLALADIETEGLSQTAAACSNAGSVRQIELNVASRESWEAALRNVQGSWPRCDLFIQAAGVTGAGEVGQFPLDDWEWLLKTNLLGTIFGCHTLVPWLKENRSARIVNIASLAAAGSFPAMGAYNVAKSGVVALSETLHGELKPHGVSVTVALPGFFATPLIARGRFSDESLRKSGQSVMENAKITAADIARAILHAAARRKLYVVTPLRARVVWRLKRFAPNSLARLAAWVYKRECQTRQTEKA